MAQGVAFFPASMLSQLARPSGFMQSYGAAISNAVYAAGGAEAVRALPDHIKHDLRRSVRNYLENTMDCALLLSPPPECQPCPFRFDFQGISSEEKDCYKPQSSQARAAKSNLLEE